MLHRSAGAPVSEELTDALIEVTDGLRRGKGGFRVCVGVPHTAFCLVVSAPKAVDVGIGFTIGLGLRRDQLLELRRQCDELLGGTS